MTSFLALFGGENLDLKYDHFYKRNYQNRKLLILEQLSQVVQGDQLLSENYDDGMAEVIENYLTNYQIPEGIATNIVVNGTEHLVPMVTEEPSVIAACSNGAKLLATMGGIKAEVQSNLVAGQVVIKTNSQSVVAQFVSKNERKLLQVANQSHPSILSYATGAKRISVRVLDPKYVSVDLLVDSGEAMGANIVNSMLEAVKAYMQENLDAIEPLMAILTNDGESSLVNVSGKVSFASLETKTMSGDVVAERISAASHIAQIDPVRAATHNKGIMNGVDAAAIALGNDWRAIESAAHSFAAKRGNYRGLSNWQISDGNLVGTMTIPIPIGFVGGATRVFKLAKLNQEIAQVSDSEQEMQLIAAVGLAQNLAALKALVTEGIQRGHMSLAVKSAVIANGATPDEVSTVVERLTTLGKHDAETIKKVINEIRKERKNNG